MGAVNDISGGIPAGSARSQRGRVTISHLATALGLTKGTVSRALNGYPDISEATRLRVSKAAETMGYRPLAHAQAIRTGRARSLGLVLQVEQHDAQRAFLADFLQGISTAASREGWTLTVAAAPGAADGLETISRLVADRKADGFILPRTMLEDPRIALLRREGVPFVMFGRTRDPKGAAWFDILGEVAMQQAVARLHDQGHRRIGFVNGPGAFTYAALRFEGYRAGLAAAGMEADPRLEITGAATADDGARAAEVLLADPNPPTAILCATDMAAMGVCRTARALGLTLGRDLSVIGYDGIPDGAMASPPLTSFEVNQCDAGERLAQLLIRRIRGTAAEELRETGFATLREGGTDGPPARTSEALAAHLRNNHQRSTHLGGSS